MAQDVIEALKRAEQMRIEFVANVSHELRTPLTSIKGYTETILQDLEEGRPVDPQFVRVILRNSDRLLALMNDLLDLSAIEAGVDELHPVWVQAETMIHDVGMGLEPLLKSKDSTLKVEVSAPQVYADQKRLEQVLTNLMDNAIKYCPKGSTITVKSVASKLSSGRDGVRMIVQDNGPGISQEHLDRLFERFYRIDKGRSREQGGTGLGLSIVKHVMQRHEGQVLVESHLGSGTTFICEFPHPKEIGPTQIESE